MTYGQDGEWAIAVWVKWDIGAGDALEYILSQNNSDNSNAALSPDTVAIYVPEEDNPSYGIVRALVNDGSDRQGNSSAPLYLDSSGCISQLNCPSGNNVSLVRTNFALPIIVNEAFFHCKLPAVMKIFTLIIKLA